MPTPDVASRDERHPFGLEALEFAQAVLGGPPASTSISHTRGLTVAVAVAAGDGDRVGVDIERVHPARPRIARRILVEGDGSDGSWPGTLAVFCAKEAAYKSLPAEFQVALTFRRVRLRQGLNGEQVAHRAHDDVPLAEVATVVTAEVIVALALAVAGPTSPPDDR